MYISFLDVTITSEGRSFPQNTILMNRGQFEYTIIYVRCFYSKRIRDPAKMKEPARLNKHFKRENVISPNFCQYCQSIQVVCIIDLELGTKCNTVVLETNISKMSEL